MVAMAATLALAAAARPAQDTGPAEAGVDNTLAPGDDFFGWANGAWLAATPAPAGRARVTAIGQIAEQATRQRAEVIRDAANFDAPDLAASGRKVADFMTAYLDEARIESLGLAAVAPLLEGIDRLADKTALARWLGHHLPADADPTGLGTTVSAHLFGLAVVPGLHGQPRPFAALVQGGLGLGTREAYLDEAEAAVQRRARYREHVARLLQAAGYDRAPRRAEAVLALESALARGHAGAAESDRESNADQRWPRHAFARRAPGLDWPAFFGAAGLGGKAVIVVWQPGALQATAALVASQPLAVWQDYLRFHVLHRHADVLPAALARPAAAWRDLQAGRPEPQPRLQRALAAVEEALPDAVARLYVARHLPPPAQARVQAILEQVAAAFARRVAAVQWLSPATRQRALANLRAVHFGVGYPRRWPDGAGPTIDPGDALGNLQRAEEWKRRQALARLERVLDRDAWFVAPQQPMAVLHYQLNAYNFAAALLQPPKFDAGAGTEASNYGAIGAILGHELSHFVDTLGAPYDERGASRPWWTAADRARYGRAVRPLVDQFAACQPLPGLAIDGRRTLVENLADLAGLASAFDAYRATPAAQTADAAARRGMDRAFFIGFARSWRAQAGEAALRAQLATDTHAPERWRVATVRNLDAWYEAFDVRPGQALYLPPAARVRVW